jgi:type IX secretion system PorP/SprF family membrane protein
MNNRIDHKRMIYFSAVSGRWIILILSFFSFKASCQDIHYAQYMYSPLNLNPANTGMFDGDYRIAANHREQWNSVTVPYKTYSFSFDMKLEKPGNEKTHFNAGILLNSDKAGDSEFGTFDGELSFGVIHTFGEDERHTLSAGIQTGLIQRSINYNKLTFDNQFNGDVFDPSAPAGEDFQVSRFYYFSLNAGIAWKYRIGDNHSIGSGISLQHLNKPDQTFFDDRSVQLPVRLQFNLNGNIALTDRIHLLPDINMMKQSTFTEYIAGCQARFNLSDKPGKQYALFLGLEARLKDAVIPMIGMDYNALHIGVSYDVNTSGLKHASNGKGGLELALVYIIRKVKSAGVKPPCVIY